ncbi:MAG: sigma-70 family RNA polymerase sigma factor [Bacteroidales bacterium]|nr:sigma-70 family RNA polymerase sigma factor [Bacteroidales bacterium]MCF8337561.1 sigma-70 family RNA polymerase sigma factor [Bacteroidales bacterium]
MEDFKSIIDEYYPVLYKIGRSFTNRPADFDDLYQEMLIQIHHSLNNFRSEAKLSTWIYRVALNTALTFNRSSKKSQNETPTGNWNYLNKEEDSGTEAQEREANIEMLYSAINELKKEERAIILLHLEGKHYDEIADIMGISTSNTGVKLMRIKNKLQSILRRKGYERA